ncbi:isochorismatase hydrolase [Acetobacter nitrogenifigens DSM 23921 = NBRC 105050]|uniref:Hydrolase n=1 Tax=Acetobacter nitrogenifigens DSM 23921 = NBRC 105050 TaxID=1120919 RepID=A0A511XEM0_9PROT|nr:isochorismatase family cysteine hydrolase [Acetobacter nitrogenifigens]GBQ96597.1 isochorismatase hydrolase [Acetobacter nitrogenifigens DSM 23921 = NBRC 105050]GEN61410.1 hydrolase [Acetobacter nitrogenifigens DSM 23921 = NBRC 105050]
MPLTALDPKTALLVVDLQKGVLNAPFITPLGDVIKQTRLLIDAFRKHGLPIVLINVAGGAPGRTEQPRRHDGPFAADFTDFLPELDRLPEDIVVTKKTWGAFASTDLEKRLKGLGVTQVVLTGVATGTGVEATARQAYEAGFNVTLARDAMTDVRPDGHEYSINTVFPRLGETGDAQQIVDLLSSRSA